MGTLWHLWSPVLISLAALFSKGEDSRATWALGLNFAGSICVCVNVGGQGEVWACVCVCTRVCVSVQEACGAKVWGRPLAAGDFPGSLGRMP